MSIILFIAILAALIFVHELGHFSVAKFFRIRVDEFGIGFPPKIFGIKKGETEYTLNWLPIGGFVKIWGEDPSEEVIKGKDYERSLIAKPRLVQIAVLIAGVTMNVLFAYLLISIAFTLGVSAVITDENRPFAEDTGIVIIQTLPNTPASTADIRPNDEILGISTARDTLENLTAQGVSDFIAANEGEELTITFDRLDIVSQTTVIPKVLPDTENPAIGIRLGEVGTVTYPVARAFTEGIGITWNMLQAVTIGILTFFAGAFSLQADLSQVAGPVGIVGLVEDASAFGLASLLTFTALISLNLAIINMMPFPALDGGRIVFVLVEMVKGSRIHPGFVRTANTIGFILLILLMVAITYSDIAKLFG